MSKSWDTLHHNIGDATLTRGTMRDAVHGAVHWTLQSEERPLLIVFSLIVVILFLSHVLCASGIGCVPSTHPNVTKLDAHGPRATTNHPVHSKHFED